MGKKKAGKAIEIDVPLGDMRQVMKFLRHVSNDVAMTFSRTAIHFVMVDPAHVAMISGDIQKKFFTRYQVKNELELGLDIDKVLEAMRMGKASDTLELSYDDEKGKWIIKVGNIRCHIKAVDIAGLSHPKVPNLDGFALDYPVKVAELKRACIAAGCVGDILEMVADGKTFMMGANLEGEEAWITFEEKKPLVDDGPVGSIYPLEYIKDFSKTAPSDVVRLRLGEKYPLQAALDRPGLELTYMLAPRIENEED